MIKVPKSPTADTRTCDFANTSKDTLLASRCSGMMRSVWDAEWIGYLLKTSLTRMKRMEGGSVISYKLRHAWRIARELPKPGTITEINGESCLVQSAEHAPGTDQIVILQVWVHCD